MQKKIKISDATLRDGNHAIRHKITGDQIKRYCIAAEKAKIDIVEIGHGNGLLGDAPYSSKLSQLWFLKFRKAVNDNLCS